MRAEIHANSNMLYSFLIPGFFFKLVFFSHELNLRTPSCKLYKEDTLTVDRVVYTYTVVYREPNYCAQIENDRDRAGNLGECHLYIRLG